MNESKLAPKSGDALEAAFKSLEERVEKVAGLLGQVSEENDRLKAEVAKQTSDLERLDKDMGRVRSHGQADKNELLDRLRAETELRIAGQQEMALVKDRLKKLEAERIEVRDRLETLQAALGRAEAGVESS